MNLALKFCCGWCLTVISILALPAHAQLAEENVLLLWNSQDSESSQIAAAYLLVRPNVHSFDLNINYANYLPNSQANPNCTCQGCDCDSTCSECECCSCPTYAYGQAQNPDDAMAMNKYYITPKMYDEFIRQPLMAYIANFGEPYGTEPILAIVTTRGIPSTVSRSFDSAVNHVSGPNQNTCIKGSLEMHLAVLGYTSTPLVNPYFGHLNLTFKAFLDTPTTVCMAGGASHKGKMFLVSRLDSDDADGDGNYVEDVVALIQRSTQLTVNKFGVTLVFDSLADANTDQGDRQVARYMRTRNWCVYFDQTPQFLHGAFQPLGVGCGELAPNLEGVYTSWPELVHATRGKGHYTEEPICHDYTRWYKIHPAGFFDSMESYNGVGMRKPEYPGPLPDPPTDSWQQGSVLHWIAAGGSFTFGNVNGPVQSNPLRAHYTIPNLYEHRLTWGEAIWSGLAQFTGVQIPVGDPLAVVTVYDPDMIPDGIINQEDLDFVEARLGQPGPEGDINLDGIVDEKDIDLVEEVFGRDANAMPEFPGSPYWPLVPITANRCGDVDNDGVVDSDDLVLILGHIGETCPALDVNHDGTVTIDDYHAARSNLGKCLGDVNNDGVVNNTDYLAVFLYPIQNPSVPQCPHQNCKICLSHPAWNPVYDVNCDGCVNFSDAVIIQNYIDQGVTCN